MAGYQIDRLSVGLGYDIRGLVTGEAAMKRSLANIASFVKSPTGVMLGLGLATTAVSIKAVHEAAKWQHSWAEVKTILSGTESEIRGVEKAVLDLANVVPQDQSLLAKGYYQTISSGITNTKDALQVLGVASRTAVAGLTDTFTSVDVITTILNAYGLQAADATHVSDLLFTTVREGKTLFPELAGAVGAAIPFFAQANVKLEDLLSALATLTKGGLSTERAVTALRAMMVQIIKPADEAKEVARKLGIAFTTEAVAAQGLVPWLQDLAQKTEGNTEAISKLFPNIRGIVGVLALAGKQAGEFARIQDVMANKVDGNARRAFETMNNTLEAQATLLKNKVRRGWIDLGDTLLGGTMKAITAVNEALDPDQFNPRLRIFRDMRDELDNMDQVALPLANRFDELKSKTKLTADETQELHDVTQKLAKLYPDFVTAVNKAGEALDYSTEALRRARANLSGRVDEDARKLLEGRLKAIYWIRRDAVEAQREIVSLNRQLASGGALVTAGPTGTGAKYLTPEQARKRRDDLLLFLQGLQGKYEALNQVQGEFLDASNLRDPLITWAKYTDQVTKTGEGVKEAAQAQEILNQRLSPGTVEKYRDELLRLGRALQNQKDKTTDLAGSLLAGATVPIPTDTVDAARKMAKDAADAADEELRKFVEDTLGRKFIGNQFGLLDDATLDFFRSTLEERKKLEDQHRKEKAEADRRALEEERRLYQQDLQAREDAYIQFLHEQLKLQELLGVHQVGPEQGPLTGAVDPDAIRRWVAAAAGITLPTGPFAGGGTTKAADQSTKSLIGDVESLTRGFDDLGRAMGKGHGVLLDITSAGLNFGQALESGALGPLGIAGAAVGAFGSVLGLFHHDTISAEEALRRADAAVKTFADSLAGLTGPEVVKTEANLKAMDAALRKYENAVAAANDYVANYFKEHGSTPQIGSQAYQELQRLYGLQNAAYNDLVELARKLNIQLPEGVKSADALRQFLDDVLGSYQDFLRNVGKFQEDTFSGVMEKLRYQFNLLGQEDPSQQLELILEALKRFTKGAVDLTGLLALAPDQLERAKELIGGLVTGILPGFVRNPGDLIGNALALAQNASNPYIIELSKILGKPIEEVVSLLQALVSGQLTTDEIQNLFSEIGSAAGAAGADAADTVSFSRNVSITEQQGADLVGQGNTRNLYLRDIRDNTAVMARGFSAAGLTQAAQQARDAHLASIHGLVADILSAMQTRDQARRRADQVAAAAAHPIQISVTTNPGAPPTVEVTGASPSRVTVTSRDRTRAQGAVRYTRRGP